MFSGSAAQIKTQVSAAPGTCFGCYCRCSTRSCADEHVSLERGGGGTLGGAFPSPVPEKDRQAHTSAQGRFRLRFRPGFCAFAGAHFQTVGESYGPSAHGQCWRRSLLPSAVPAPSRTLISAGPVCQRPAMLPAPWFFGCRAKCYRCATQLARGTVSLTDNRAAEMDLSRVVKSQLISVRSCECLP